MQHPFDVQQRDVGLPQLMVAWQRGIVTDNPFHFRLAVCLKHTQQYCREKKREREQVVKADARELLGRALLKGFQWLYCRTAGCGGRLGRLQRGEIHIFCSASHARAQRHKSPPELRGDD